MPKASIDLIELLWRYVLRLSGRLDRLIARWKNGTLPKPRAPRPSPSQDQTRAARTPPKLRFPHARRWLFRILPNNGFIRGQLQHLLANNEEFAAFLEAAPQARRLLNPLCRILDIDLDAPYGVPRVKPQPSQQSQPEPAATAPPAPSSPPPGPAPPAVTLRKQKIVFSSP
jgi:hypothetical protein